MDGMTLKAVEIQTTNFCNAHCVICPHAYVYAKRKIETMSLQQFESIINKLPIKKDTILIPYLNNEPLSDRGLYEKIRFLRERFPFNPIELSTNLSLFNGEYDQLKKGKINDFRISFFGFTERTYESIMPGLKWSMVYEKLLDLAKKNLSDGLFEKISITMIDCEGLTELDKQEARRFCDKYDIKLNVWGFLDRAGNVKKYKNIIKRDMKATYHCEQNRPFERVHILVDGKIIICCQDWKEKYVLGNIIKTDDFDTIVNSPENRELRRRCGGKINCAPAICQKCKLFVCK